MSLVQQALKEAGVSPAEISCIAYTKVCLHSSHGAPVHSVQEATSVFLAGRQLFRLLWSCLACRALGWEGHW